MRIRQLLGCAVGIAMVTMGLGTSVLAEDASQTAPQIDVKVSVGSSLEEMVIVEDLLEELNQVVNVKMPKIGNVVVTGENSVGVTSVKVSTGNIVVNSLEGEDGANVTVVTSPDMTSSSQTVRVDCGNGGIDRQSKTVKIAGGTVSVNCVTSGKNAKATVETQVDVAVEE